MHRVVVVFLFSMIFTTIFPVLADDKPTKFPKFGDVSESILNMTSYAPEPDADAVVLFERMSVDIRSKETLFTGQLRIKILTEAGKDRGDWRIGGYYYDGIKFLDVNAVAISPDGKKSKVRDDDIFDERIDDWIYKVFAVPGVEVGSVIDIEYKIESTYWDYVPTWYFQSDIYTQASQYSVSLPPGYNFRVFFYNLEDLQPMQEDEFDIEGSIKKDIIRFTWEVFDLPPIPDAPFMRTKEDYLAQVRFQLVDYKSRGQYISYIKDWPSLAKKMEERYKPLLAKDDGIKALANEKTIGLTEPEEQVAALYNFVTREIETTKKGDQYTGKDVRLSTILSKKQGTGVEKNLLLVSLLKHAGISADPLLISTRNRRRALADNPDLNQFNYVIVAATVGSKRLYMDTRNPRCTYRMLPTNSLVNEGFIINDKGGEFVKIPTPRSLNMKRYETTASLDASGSLTATSSLRFEDYAALTAREKIEKDGKQTYINNIFESAFVNVNVDSFSIEGLETTDTPLIIQVNYLVEDFAQISGDLLYLKAPALNAFAENPLKSEIRRFPVEFTGYNATNEVMRITLPEGFEVAELPKPAKVGQRKLRYVNSWKFSENILTVERQFMRRSTIFPINRYAELREFYDYTVQFDQRQIAISQSGK